MDVITENERFSEDGCMTDRRNICSADLEVHSRFSQYVRPLGDKPVTLVSPTALREALQ